MDCRAFHLHRAARILNAQKSTVACLPGSAPTRQVGMGPSWTVDRILAAYGVLVAAASCHFVVVLSGLVLCCLLCRRLHLIKSRRRQNGSPSNDQNKQSFSSGPLAGERTLQKNHVSVSYLKLLAFVVDFPLIQAHNRSVTQWGIWTPRGQQFDQLDQGGRVNTPSKCRVHESHEPLSFILSCSLCLNLGNPSHL